MKTHNDFLVEYSVNGLTISDYIAYVRIDDYNFHRTGGDINNNRETPLTLEEFQLIADETDIQEMFTEQEINEYFVNQMTHR